jgi:hypothetical protein
MARESELVNDVEDDEGDEMASDMEVRVRRRQSRDDMVLMPWYGDVEVGVMQTPANTVNALLCCADRLCDHRREAYTARLAELTANLFPIMRRTAQKEEARNHAQRFLTFVTVTSSCQRGKGQDFSTCSLMPTLFVCLRAGYHDVEQRFGELHLVARRR